MVYRVCKSFEIESGHMLSKHPGRCRLPHGHSRRIDVVLSSPTLDQNDMVCDFKALKLALEGFLDRFDHALAVNSADAITEQLAPELRARVIVFEDEDPTTEAMARRIYEHLAGELARGSTYTDPAGNSFRLRPEVTIERVRVGETSTSWAEYGLGS